MSASKPTASEIKASSDKFAESHFIRFPELFEEDRIGVYWLQKVGDAVENGLRSKVNTISTLGPTWAMTRTMLGRVYEHCEGSFISWLAGTWSTTEVAVRATMEAAVNLMYITAQDKEKRLVQYLTYFWSNEKELSQKRLNMVSSLHGEDAVAHREAAEANIQYNDSRKQLINTVLQNEGFSSMDESGWPKHISDRFASLRMKTEYRTIYSFLSSEAHDDASGLVDFVISKSLEQYLPPEVAKEVHLRARAYLYMGLSYYIKAASSYAASYSLNVTDEIIRAQKAVDEIIQGISMELINLPEVIKDLLSEKSHGQSKHHRKRT